MATIIRVQGNRLELAIPLQTVTMTPNGKVTEDYNVPADAEVKVVLSSSWKTYGFEPLSISGNVVTMRDDGKLPAGKYAVEVRIRQADGTPLRSKYCNIIDIRDCNDGVTQEYDDFIEGSVTLDAQIFWFAKGDDGITPHIDETTGNWFIGDEDTGVHAQGEAGTTDYNDLENKPDLSIYVEKEQGKGLSTNDFTNEEKSKVDSAYQKPASGIPASDIASGVIPDVSQFITKSVDDLLNYYLKSETYTKSEVQALIGAIQQFHYEVYASTSDVTSPANNVLYLIGPTGSGTDKYEEYVYDSTKQDPWIKIGDTSIDLSGYVTTTTLNTSLADYTTTAQLTTLLAAKQDTISDLSTIRSGAQAGATAYQKPAGGIPKTDLAQDVKDSLDKADTALQEDTLYEDANGHDYVEIAGMKWATKNIGANAVTDAGLYFQWGDTQGVPADDDSKESDNPWQTYKFAVFDGEEYVMGKYNSVDDLTKLELSDDAARESWGGSWRMPTADDFQNFLEAVNVVWVNDYQSSGVAGLVCTDKTDNSKVVFFPAAGFHNGMEVVANNNGYYWSDTRADNDYYAAKFEFNNSRTRINDGVRCDIISIRPILDTTQLKKDLDSKANTEDLADVAFSGSYNDLDDKPTIPVVPTNVSAFNNDAGYLTQHQDISGKANKSEMSVVDGTGANADKTTITLKDGTSATVLKSHQDISGKQDTLVSGTNIKTLNGESILGEGNLDIIGSYTPTLLAAPTSSTLTYVKDGKTMDFVVGQFARVADANNTNKYDVYQLYDIATENNVTTATWVEVTESTLADVDALESDNVPAVIGSENVLINLRQYTDMSSSTAAVGVVVAVTIDGVTSSFASGLTGTVSFNVAIGKQYTIVITPPEGYYVHGGKTVYEMTAETSSRHFTIRLMPYQTGLFIVDGSGNEYRFDEWKTEVAAGNKNNTEAKLIKIASAQLCEENGVFGIDIDDMRNRNYEKRIWGDSVNINPPGLNTYTYNGLRTTELILDTAAANNNNVPAAQLAYSKTKMVGNVELQGFLGARYQWAILWDVRTEVDEILTYTRPDGEYLLSTFTENKWTSTQYSAGNAYYWGTSASSAYKSGSYSTVVFFAF